MTDRMACRIVCSTICIVFALFSSLLMFCGMVHADVFLPVCPRDLVIKETRISVSLTTPVNIVVINVTEYDPQQILKNMTVEFREPVAYVGFVIEILGGSPPYRGIPRDETFLHYHTIRFLTELADKIKSVRMFFAVNKTTERERAVEEVTLMLYQFDGGKFEERPVQKLKEDEAFLYFMTESDGSSYVAVTGVPMPTLQWFAPVIIAMLALTVASAICIHGRFKLTGIKKVGGT